VRRTACALRFFEDRLGAGTTGELPESPRVLYVKEGAVEVAHSGRERAVACGAAAFADASIRVYAAMPAILWRFELSGARSPWGSVGNSTLKLAAEVELGPAPDFLFRCDRVELRPGTVTPKHIHAGPGIRALLQGDVHADIGGVRSFHRAGEAWFERGPDPVIGRMSSNEPTAFIRALILPPALRGKTSYRPWDEVAAAQPLPAQYEILVDHEFRFPEGEIT
jgi:hypothetical protein